jgi:putative toxin-antitoxin system antitoxin component (TIGR02293 family)
VKQDKPAPVGAGSGKASKRSAQPPVPPVGGQLQSAERAASLLLGMQTMRPLEWVSQIREGLPYSALESLGSRMQATNAELAQMLGVSVRMLGQRRRGGVLSSKESERLFRVACVIERAMDVFDDQDNALDWMSSPIIVLRSATPFSLLDTDIGGQIVMTTLGRIQHGIPA